MKITDYPKVETLKDDNVFLLDGPDGTKSMYAKDLATSIIKESGNLPEGVTFDDTYSIGWHVQTGNANSAVTLDNVEMGELQTVINNLPKYLDRDVNINVLAGTGPAGALTISGFTGPGELGIHAMSPVQNSHVVERIVIAGFKGKRVAVSGLTCSATIGTAIMISFVPTRFAINNCYATGGSKDTDQNFGVYAIGGSFGVITDSTISNKRHAIYSQTGSVVEVIRATGINNFIAHAFDSGGTIRLVIEADQPIQGEHRYGASSSGLLYDYLHSVGWHVQNGLLLAERIIDNVQIADLQTVLDSLPKYLDRSVRINVLPGTVDTQVAIDYHTGPGYLQIFGAAGAISTSHNVERFIVRGCNNSGIIIQGFNITSSTGDGVHCTNSRHVAIEYCRFAGGVKTNIENHGIVCIGPGTAMVNSCLLSNKSVALQTYAGHIKVYTLSGVDNGIACFALDRGQIQANNIGSIAADTMWSLAYGGLYVKPDGGVNN